VIALLATAMAGVVPDDARQLVLAVVPGPDDSHATVTRWERTDGPWVAVGAPIPARIGAAGVAWGRGLHPPQPGLQKQEGDDRAPAGVFALGDAFGDAATPAPGVEWPYHPVGPRDLFVEDPARPEYNTWVHVPGDRPLEAWEAKAAMRRNDPAHALKVLVAHNAAPAVVPGAGSAIFLHVWRRDGAATTAGCTAMARPDLDVLVDWLSPAGRPVFALLTAADLARLGPEWGLPRP
jgi:L,D-peptidoglycan transpeptidase YkuD (ErfK/YbiS/YcfS/YnhG family)